MEIGNILNSIIGSGPQGSMIGNLLSPQPSTAPLGGIPVVSPILGGQSNVFGPLINATGLEQKFSSGTGKLLKRATVIAGMGAGTIFLGSPGLGAMAGQEVADILFGAKNPEGGWHTTGLFGNAFRYNGPGTMNP